MARYIVNFERVGRCHHVDDLEFEAADGDEAAGHIHKAISSYLASRHYDVILYEDGHGSILAGLRNAGTFNWSRTVAHGST